MTRVEKIAEQYEEWLDSKASDGKGTIREYLEKEGGDHYMIGGASFLAGWKAAMAYFRISD